jgi:urease subunit beta
MTPTDESATPTDESAPGQSPRRPARELVDTEPVVPGEMLYGEGDVEINAGLQVTTLRVENHGDRPVQVGSHFHFAEVNAALDFDRVAAWGKRLNVLSGSAQRFEPGAAEEVELIPITGQRIVRGLRGLCGGSLDG